MNLGLWEWLIILGGVVVLALIGIVAAILLRRDRRRLEEDSSLPADSEPGSSDEEADVSQELVPVSAFVQADRQPGGIGFFDVIAGLFGAIGLLGLTALVANALTVVLGDGLMGASAVQVTQVYTQWIFWMLAVIACLLTSLVLSTTV